VPKSNWIWIEPNPFPGVPLNIALTKCGRIPFQRKIAAGSSNMEKRRRKKNKANHNRNKGSAAKMEW
jgi:hypothetical protein